MSQPSFGVNVRGRIKNTPLPLHKPLVPLFEALANSFEAIDERRVVNPDVPYQIKISVTYDGQTALFEGEEKKAKSIKSIVVEDNGIGFNEKNFDSFLTSDSGYKEIRGGKGVGRFYWLKAFETVQVSSNFVNENNNGMKRSFHLSDDGQFHDYILISSDEPIKTIIALNSIKYSYLKNLPKGLETIAIKILEHCLTIFLRKDCPIVSIEDNEERLILNEIFKERINVDEQKETFIVGDSVFSILHVELSDSATRGNKFYLCANGRVVEDEFVDNHIVDFCNKITRGDQNYWYVGIIESEYLDKKVDSSRLSFDIPDTGEKGGISKKGIFEKACDLVENHYSQQLSEIRQQKMNQIKRYAKETAPQYRHLLIHKEDELKKIKPDLTEDKLDEQMGRINRDFEKEIKRDGAVILHNFSESSLMDSDAYKGLFENLFIKINDINKSTLAAYVGHRKIILQMMDEALKSVEGGKYEKEEFIHSMIVPVKKTTDEILYNQHNLWLIDEKLAFHFFLSSDKTINANGTHPRPDLLVLDNPIATVDTNEGETHNSIVIFELKKPMRDDYTNKENPIDQLIEYMQKIQDGAKDCNGRPIKVKPNTRFYLYAICDVTESLKPILKKFDFKETPDGEGWFTINGQYNAFIEVLPYDKMVNDAKKRNRILFEKLGCI